MDLSARSIVWLLLLAGSVHSSVRSVVDHRESLNIPTNVTDAASYIVRRLPLERFEVAAGHESNDRLTGASNNDGESSVDAEKPRSINELERSRVTSKESHEEPSQESPKESPKESSKQTNESSAKSQPIDRKNSGRPSCEDYHFDCAGCLSQGNCVFCWYEKQCVKRRHFDDANYSAASESGNPNHQRSTPRGMLNESALNALSERDAMNGNNMLIKPLGTVPKNTCPVRNTLSNISASSCVVNELTLLWLMFSSVILSVIVLFGCLFYCCVFRNQTADMIIIASDKDNFVLIDEE